MITVKSKHEIELMREAGRISNLALWTVGQAIKPGITTAELDRIAEEVIIANNAKPAFKGYEGFPGTICASINQQLVHGIPSKTVLKHGDIISIDTGAIYKGYYGDNAWTFTVGDVSPKIQELLDTTKEALYVGLAQVKPNAHISDVSHAIEEYVKAHGFSLPHDYTGHGIGIDMHEDPVIPNYGEAGHGVVLKEGMCLAIEPMVHMGKPFTKVLNNNWTVVTKDNSLSAHFEHTVVVTADGYEILTQCKESNEWENKMSLR